MVKRGGLYRKVEQDLLLCAFSFPSFPTLSLRVAPRDTLTGVHVVTKCPYKKSDLSSFAVKDQMAFTVRGMLCLQFELPHQRV